MKLTKTEFITILVTQGGFSLRTLTSLGWHFYDEYFQTISLATVTRVKNKWLDTLEPIGLTEERRVQGRLRRVPKHSMAPQHRTGQSEAGDCDTHAIVFQAFAATGNWLRSIRLKESRGGLTLSYFDLTCTPRARNGRRAGRHLQNLFVDHDKKLHIWEPGDSGTVDILPAEAASNRTGGAF